MRDIVHVDKCCIEYILLVLLSASCLCGDGGAAEEETVVGKRVDKLADFLYQRSGECGHIDIQLAQVVQGIYWLSEKSVDNSKPPKVGTMSADERRRLGIFSGIQVIGRTMPGGAQFEPGLNASFVADDFADSDDPGVRQCVAKAIGEARSASGIPTLEKLIKDADQDVARQAVWSMAELGPLAQREIPLLGRIGKDETLPWKTRRAAIVALGATESVEAEVQLKAIDQTVQSGPQEYVLLKSIILALARTGSKEAVDVLAAIRRRVDNSAQRFASGQVDRLDQCVDAALSQGGDIESCKRLVHAFEGLAENDRENVERVWIAGLLMLANKELARDALYKAWKVPRNDWSKSVFGYYLKSYVPSQKKDMYPDYWKWWCEHALVYARTSIREMVDLGIDLKIGDTPWWKEALLSY